MKLLSNLARAVRPLVERNPRLAMAFRHYRDMRHILRTPVETPLGFKFVGHSAMEAGTFEVDEVRLVRRLLQNADVLLNVGANIGYYCCLALHANKQVLAFEPIPNNLQYLYQNVNANGWADRIEVYPIALGANPGLVDIYGGGTAASLIAGWADIPQTYRQTVPLGTLDGIVGQRFAEKRCFILVDVEGAELAMLKGASSILHRDHKPVWMVEVNIDAHQPTGVSINPYLCETFDQFERAGYSAWVVGSELIPLDYSEIKSIALSGVNTLKNHNFLFADSGSLGVDS